MRGVFFCLIVLLSACSADSVQQSQVDQPVPVRVAAVSDDLRVPTIETAGTVAWREETPLGFTTQGRIARVFVNEGDRVRRGQLLAILDTVSVSSALAVAEAERKRASSEYVRLKPLVAKGWITRPRFEAAQAAAEAADASVAARRFALATARIVASSDGVILSRVAEPGQVIDEGMPVVVLGKGSSGYVLRAPLNDREAVRLSRGAPATVLLPALEGAPLRGFVSEIGGKADQTTGTFQVEIALPNDPRLRSGLIGKAAMIASVDPQLSPKLILPSLAIFGARAGEGFVYVIGRDQKAKARKVVLGETADKGTQILSGVQPGELVAVSAIDQLRDGVIVTAQRYAP
jgi:RND family efflux transporter MFP subunit